MGERGQFLTESEPARTVRTERGQRRAVTRRSAVEDRESRVR